MFTRLCRHSIVSFRGILLWSLNTNPFKCRVVSCFLRPVQALRQITQILWSKSKTLQLWIENWTYCWWKKSGEPVEVGSWNPIIYNDLILYIYPRWLFGISEPSTVAFLRRDGKMSFLLEFGWHMSAFLEKKTPLENKKNKHGHDVSQIYVPLISMCLVSGQHWGPWDF